MLGFGVISLITQNRALKKVMWQDAQSYSSWPNPDHGIPWATMNFGPAMLLTSHSHAVYQCVSYFCVYWPSKSFQVPTGSHPDDFAWLSVVGVQICQSTSTFDGTRSCPMPAFKAPELRPAYHKLDSVLTPLPAMLPATPNARPMLYLWDFLVDPVSRVCRWSNSYPHFRRSCLWPLAKWQMTHARCIWIGCDPSYIWRVNPTPKAGHLVRFWLRAIAAPQNPRRYKLYKRFLDRDHYMLPSTYSNPAFPMVSQLPKSRKLGIG